MKHLREFLADLTTQAWTRLAVIAPAWLRTVVPVAWGSASSWLLTHVTWQPVVDLVTSVDPLILAGGATAVWYALARWAEPHLTDWVTRLVLGSAQVPAYDAVAVKSPDGPVAGPGSIAADGTPVAVLIVEEDLITDAGQA